MGSLCLGVSVHVHESVLISLLKDQSLPIIFSVITRSQGGAVFFSSGNVGAVASNIKNCVFSQNSAYSGWGGAFFGTDSLGPLYITTTTFTKNNAYSR